MAYMATAQEWLTQSSQLLEARPTTTRVTTKYNIMSARAKAARKSAKDDADAAAAATTTATDKPPRAKLILKTFDASSGVCLKYKTNKAAEVGRLIQMLGSLGRNMAALPPAAAAPVALDDEAVGTATPSARGGTPVPAAGAAAGLGGGEGGKGKKKKKGKR